jgi:hypothetical protein
MAGFRVCAASHPSHLLAVRAFLPILLQQLEATLLEEADGVVEPSLLQVSIHLHLNNG